MNVNDFLYSPIPEVKDLVERAIRIEESFNKGEISKDEYEELANDLLELKSINSEMVDLEATRELWAVINVLKNIKFFASLI